MKKAFTLLELMIVVVILWIWLVWVFLTLNNAYSFIQWIKQKTMAINFARWWVEWVFSIRNTNWQRWWWKKDKCWLKINPLVDDNNDWCENDPWFQDGSYILQITWTQQYFILEKINTPFNPTWPLTWDDWQYLLCVDNNTNLINACPSNSQPTSYFDPTYFFRQVRWWYLLDKNVNTFINCTKWTDTNCWDGRFLEKNFCVDVFYFDWTKKKVTFCTVMTNFKEDTF